MMSRAQNPNRMRKNFHSVPLARHAVEIAMKVKSIARECLPDQGMRTQDKRRARGSRQRLHEDDVRGWCDTEYASSAVWQSLILEKSQIAGALRNCRFKRFRIAKGTTALATVKSTSQKSVAVGRVISHMAQMLLGGVHAGMGKW
jgi:hypothetical protein